MIRLLVIDGSLGSKLIWERIQRCERRSYSTCGSVTSRPSETEDQKLPSVTSRTPALFPFLSNTRIRPLTATRIWVGPTEPIESGGRKVASPILWAPRNEVPAVSSDFGAIGAERVSASDFAEGGLFGGAFSSTGSSLPSPATSSPTPSGPSPPSAASASSASASRSG